MQPIRTALGFGLGALVVGLALTTLPAAAASPSQAGMAAVQSAIRDIRDRAWQRSRIEQQQVRPVAKRPSIKSQIR